MAEPEGSLFPRSLLAAADRVVAARQPAIALPAGGSVEDVEARNAISALVARLEAHGLIESN